MKKPQRRRVDELAALAAGAGARLERFIIEVDHLLCPLDLPRCRRENIVGERDLVGVDAPLADGAERGGPGGLLHVGLVVPEVAERAVDRVDAGGPELPPERFPAMLELLDQGLDAGALGIGLAVQYYPGASRREIFEVFRFAGEKRATIHTHVRSMTVNAMQEVLANAVGTGAPLHIVHVNSMALGEIDTVLDLIGGARCLGLDVTTEAYPYTAGSTSLHSSIFDEGWQDRLGIDYGDLQWEATGERLTRETFERYRRERGTVVLHFMKEEWIETALGNDWVIVASDGMPYAPKAHPRTAGTYSRVLGRYVRERGTLDLMTALLKMSFLPARRVASMSDQMRNKGKIQVGADADIVVFDPETVIDTATFEGGLSFSEGIRHTMVNGVFVVRDGETVEGVAPGRAIVGRFAGVP